MKRASPGFHAEAVTEALRMQSEHLLLMNEPFRLPFNGTLSSDEQRMMDQCAFVDFEL